MRLYAGTSGFSYPAWKGSFYPCRIRAKDMLAHYATHLTACEINGTFYRTPAPEAVLGWAKETPPTFSFVLKAPMIVCTLKHPAVEEALLRFYDARRGLGERAGPVLVQLPKHLKKDLPVLRAFLAKIPAEERVAIEFMDPSWLADDVLEVLREGGRAIVMADDPARSTGLVRTAPWGYARFRRPTYTGRALGEWLARAADLGFTEMFAFFRHEDTGRGPRLARKLIGLS